jgi:DNA-binding beta-propeller fold protein YncE
MTVNEANRSVARPWRSPLPAGRWTYYFALGITSLGIALTMALALWYLQTRQPLSEAPGVSALPGVSTAPSAPPFLFAIYGLNRPLGVAVSPDGQWIYATDREGERVVNVYDRTGQKVGALTPPAAHVPQWHPLNLAFAPDGSLYVSDPTYGALHVFGSDGAYGGVVQPVGLESDGWWSPYAVAVDATGTLYVTDVAEDIHRVVVLDPSGTVRAQFGREGVEPGELFSPSGIAVDGNGLVYVSDSYNGRVQLLDPQTGPLTVVETMRGLSLPRGITIAGDRLYLADTIGHAVLVYSLANGTPQLLYTMSEMGLADGELRFPEALAVDRTGRIYVADRANNRIQVFGQ